jgi:predicted lysophospholipase L1 biosynthesis ABC-type transport system permease subunit
LIFGAIVGLLGAATLAQTLITSIRRRRRDLSVLKTLGFSAAQVRGAVAGDDVRSGRGRHRPATGAAAGRLA